MKSLLAQKLTDDGESLPFANFATSLRVAFMKFVTIRVPVAPKALRRRIHSRFVSLSAYIRSLSRRSEAEADSSAVGFVRFVYL